MFVVDWSFCWLIDWLVDLLFDFIRLCCGFLSVKHEFSHSYFCLSTATWKPKKSTMTSRKKMMLTWYACFTVLIVSLSPHTSFNRFPHQPPTPPPFPPLHTQTRSKQNIKRTIVTEMCFLPFECQLYSFKQYQILPFDKCLFQEWMKKGKMSCYKNSNASR